MQGPLANLLKKYSLENRRQPSQIIMMTFASHYIYLFYALYNDCVYMTEFLFKTTGMCQDTAAWGGETTVFKARQPLQEREPCSLILQTILSNVKKDEHIYLLNM
jgi:hypothetical protein